MKQETSTGLALIAGCAVLVLLSLYLSSTSGSSNVESFVAGMLGGMPAGIGLLGVFFVARSAARE